MRYHPNFGYTYTPQLKSRVAHEGGGYLVQTNAQGFRDDKEFVPTKTPGTFRILVFGDSYTAGDGVSNKHRYTDLLAQQLPGVEVYNFGLSGTGTDQQFLIFQERVQRQQMDYDLVIVMVMVENILRVNAKFRQYQDEQSHATIMAKPYFTLDAQGHLVRHHDPVPPDPIDPTTLTAGDKAYTNFSGLLPRLSRVLSFLGPKLKNKLRKWVGYQPLPQYNSPKDPAWIMLKTLLNAWSAEVKTPMIILPFPVHQYVEEHATSRHYRARFQELNLSDRVILCDLMPELMALPMAVRRSFRFAVDPHPTKACHAWVAKALAAVVKKVQNRYS